MIQKRTEIEKAISGLKNLLKDRSATEQNYQNWFEQNPTIFEALNFKNFISQPKIIDFKEKELKPDFITQSLNGTWEIFELKLPTAKILKNKEYRKTFYAQANEYIQQCLDYSEFFNDHINRQNFEKSYNIKIDSAPKSKLVIGRDNNLNRYDLIKHLGDKARNVDILTYDDILTQLEYFKISTLGEYENVPGIAIHFIANLKQNKKENYLLSLGKEEDKNQISIFISGNDQLCFQIIDNEGNHNTSRVKIKNNFQYNKLTYFVFEIGISKDYSVVSIELNGKYGSINYLDDLELNLEEIMDHIVVGSNFDGEKSSKFELFEQIIWQKTFNIQQRINLRNNVFENYFSIPEIDIPRAGFYNHRFFYKNSNSNFKSLENHKPTDLVQAESDLQPELISKDIPRGQIFIPCFYDQSE